MADRSVIDWHWKLKLLLFSPRCFSAQYLRAFLTWRDLNPSPQSIHLLSLTILLDQEDYCIQLPSNATKVKTPFPPHPTPLGELLQPDSLSDFHSPLFTLCHFSRFPVYLSPRISLICAWSELARETVSLLEMLS